MGYYPKALERLVLELGKLPGIGEKTAQRLAFHIINLSEEEIVITPRINIDYAEKGKDYLLRFYVNPMRKMF